MRLLFGVLGLLLVMAILGLAGESDIQSIKEARYRSALAQIDAAREVGR